MKVALSGLESWIAGASIGPNGIPPVVVEMVVGFE
jgi:hypothetical protein